MTAREYALGYKDRDTVGDLRLPLRAMRTEYPPPKWSTDDQLTGANKVNQAIA